MAFFLVYYFRSPVTNVRNVQTKKQSLNNLTVIRLFGAWLPLPGRQVLANHILDIGRHHFSQFVRQDFFNDMSVNLLLRFLHGHHIVSLLELGKKEEETNQSN